jgi:hypothetical protein
MVHNLETPFSRSTAFFTVSMGSDQVGVLLLQGLGALGTRCLNQILEVNPGLTNIVGKTDL